MTIVSRWKEILIPWRTWRKPSSPGTSTEMGRYLSLSCRYFSFVNFLRKKIQQLQSAVNKSGQRLSEEEMNAIFVIGDVDQNGEIDLQEFKRMMLPTSFDVVSKFRSVHKTTRDVQNAFKQFDINNDGSIDRLVFNAKSQFVIWWESRSELTQALTSGGHNFTQQEIAALFNAADVNKDGTVSIRFSLSANRSSIKYFEQLK